MFPQIKSRSTIDPKFDAAFNNRGILYQERREIRLALADYNQAIKINPNYTKAYAGLGALYIQMEDTKAAISNLRKAQQLFIAQNNTAIAGSKILNV